MWMHLEWIYDVSTLFQNDIKEIMEVFIMFDLYLMYLLFSKNI